MYPRGVPSRQVIGRTFVVGVGLALALLGWAGDAAADEDDARRVVGDSAADEVGAPVGPPSRFDDAATASMRRSMHAYFAGETREAWAFGGAGVLTLGGGGAMFAADDGLYRGAAFPLVIVGAVELAAGIVLLARTDAQVAEFDRRLDADKRALLSLEAPRMERVQKEFGLLAVAELALIVAGLGVASYGGARGDHTLSGIGGGVALQSAAMLTFDAHASARADTYLTALRAFGR
jgi:hypothetical protein